MVMPRSRSRSLRIHRPFRDRLVFAECAGLFKKFVDQGGFAVVDVRDDRDIAQVHNDAF